MATSTGAAGAPALSAGRSTRGRDAQVAVAFRVELGIAEAARARPCLPRAPVLPGAAMQVAGTGRGRGVTLTGEGRPDR